MSDRCLNGHEATHHQVVVTREGEVHVSHRCWTLGCCTEWYEEAKDPAAALASFGLAKVEKPEGSR